MKYDTETKRLAQERRRYGEAMGGLMVDNH